MSDGIVLYRRIASRAISALWMLEELGVPYRDEPFAPSDPRPASLFEVSPSGYMPAISDGDARVTEAPAICLYLADKYGYGSLAPRIEDPARGRYLQWTVYATAVLEPARELQLTTITRIKNGYGLGWPGFEEVARRVADAVEAGPWLLGERFTAADVMLGSVVSISLFCGTIPPLPPLVAYNERLMARPANQRAQQLNWPPGLFGGKGSP